MNERIKELKYQAEELAWLEHKANCTKNGREASMPHANALNMIFEKFAELIVRECAEVSFKHWERHKECSAHFSIREHFGVEE